MQMTTVEGRDGAQAQSAATKAVAGVPARREGAAV